MVFIIFFAGCIVKYSQSRLKLYHHTGGPYSPIPVCAAGGCSTEPFRTLFFVHQGRASPRQHDKGQYVAMRNYVPDCQKFCTHCQARHEYDGVHPRRWIKTIQQPYGLNMPVLGSKSSNVVESSSHIDKTPSMGAASLGVKQRPRHSLDRINNYVDTRVLV